MGKRQAPSMKPGAGPSIAEVFSLEDVDAIETHLHAAVGAENIAFIVSTESNPTDAHEEVAGRGDLVEQAVRDTAFHEHHDTTLYLYAVVRLKVVEASPKFLPLPPAG